MRGVRAVAKLVRTIRQQEASDENCMARLAADYRKFGFRPGKPPPPIDLLGDARKQLAFERGKPLSNTANACVMLREHGDFSGIVALDLDSGKVFLMGRMPDDWAPDFEMRPLEHDDITGLQEHLQRRGLVDLTRKDVLFAVHRIARENAGHFTVEEMESNDA